MNDQAFNVKLVEEVEKHPCLYNYQLTQYSRKDITDLAWNNIGKKMNMSGMYILLLQQHDIYNNT